MEEQPAAGSLPPPDFFVPAYQADFRLTALLPRASGWTSNDTLSPSLSELRPAASTAVAWTNTSLPPPSGAMKPKPFAELKNFTVPIVIVIFLRLRIPRAHMRERAWKMRHQLFGRFPVLRHAQSGL